MKKRFFILGLFFLSSLFLVAQTTDYKVVFDLTSKDSLDQQAVIRWLREITTERPDAKLEVVMYAKGINMVTKDRSSVADAVTKLTANKNISFKVCAIALKNQGIDKLLEAITLESEMLELKALWIISPDCRAAKFAVGIGGILELFGEHCVNRAMQAHFSRVAFW